MHNSQLRECTMHNAQFAMALANEGFDEGQQ